MDTKMGIVLELLQSVRGAEAGALTVPARL